MLTLKKGDHLAKARLYTEGQLEDAHRYQAKSLPSRGAIPPVDQLSLEDFS